MEKPITPEDRKRLALKAGISEAVLYQSMNGYSQINPAKCVLVETALDGELRRWDLRPKDWHEIWPELIGLEGAPPVPVKA
jgi:DNA-binding transcriptional regulator YdaS (Cro superfamily)